MGLKINVFKKLVKQSGYKLKDFAPKLGYKGIGGLNSAFARDNMGMDKVYRAADLLNVTVEDIYEFEKNNDVRDPNTDNRIQTTTKKPMNKQDEMLNELIEDLKYYREKSRRQDKIIEDFITAKNQCNNQSTGTYE